MFPSEPTPILDVLKRRNIILFCTLPFLVPVPSLTCLPYTPDHPCQGKRAPPFICSICQDFNFLVQSTYSLFAPLSFCTHIPQSTHAGLCVVMFHLANAAMLPEVGLKIDRLNNMTGHEASIKIGERHERTCRAAHCSCTHVHWAVKA